MVGPLALMNVVLSVAATTNVAMMEVATMEVATMAVRVVSTPTPVVLSSVVVGHSNLAMLHGMPLGRVSPVVIQVATSCNSCRHALPDWRQMPVVELPREEEEEEGAGAFPSPEAWVVGVTTVALDLGATTTIMVVVSLLTVTKMPVSVAAHASVEVVVPVSVTAVAVVGRMAIVVRMALGTASPTSASLPATNVCPWKEIKTVQLTFAQ